MKIKKLLLTAAVMLAALFATSTIAFGSSAIVDSKSYTHPSQFSDAIIIDGIDVSYYQSNINWTKVKQHGIDYAYIRLGFSYLASPHRTNLDSFFEQNYENAREAGVMVGVYYYSTATTVAEAQKEAKFVLDTLDDRELDLPVAFDFEMPSDSRVYTAYYNWSSSTRKTKAASNALAFLNYIEKNSDYEAMFYSYRAITSPYGSPSTRKINMDLIDTKYRVWLAQYSTDNSYERPYDTWQYTSSGSVDGISGNVDCDFWYFDNDAQTTESGTTSIKKASISLGTSSYTFNGKAKEPSVTVTYNGKTLTEGKDYNVYYIKNVLAGTGYAMVRGTGSYSNTELVPFTINKQKMSNATVSDITSKFIYNGSARKPTIKVTYGGKTLTRGTDYTVSYSNNTNAGTGTVTVTGKRNFTGTVTKNFTISKATPTFSGTTSYETNAADSFKLDITSNSGQTLTYKSSDISIATVSADGTVTMQGKTGTVIITVTSPSSQNYNSASKTVTIKVARGDATISTGRPSYTKLLGCGSFSLLTKTNSDGEITYESSDPTVATVNENGRVTPTGKAGTTTLTIKTAETAAFNAGSKSVKLTIATQSDLDRIISGIENTTIKIYSSVSSGSITISWKRALGFYVDGYELYRGAGSKDNMKRYDITSKTSYKNANYLKKGTKYYYKVRGYRTVDGVKYYTNWTLTIYRTAR